MFALRGSPLLLVEKQFGVVARHQLRRWLTERQIDGLVIRGSLIPLERGVYRTFGGAVLPRQQPLAAALRCRPAATITGPFVLGHLRVDGFDETAPFEVLLRPGRRLQGVDFQTREDPYPDRAVIRLGDVRLANPLDALIDSCRWRGELADRKFRLAYDWMRWNDLIDADRVQRTLTARAPHDEGARQLLDLLGGEEGLVPESEGERRLGDLVARFDPPPVPQVRVAGSRRVDWYFESLELAIEYLGSVDHSLAANQAEDDERGQQLADAGISVVDVRSRDLDEPHALMQRIAGIVMIRAAERGVVVPTYRPG